MKRTVSAVRFKFRCNILISGKIIKEMCGFGSEWDTLYYTDKLMGTAVAQWLKCCATNRKVAVSIAAGVSGSFIDIKFFRSQYGPGVDSASNRN